MYLLTYSYYNAEIICMVLSDYLMQLEQRSFYLHLGKKTYHLSQQRDNYLLYVTRLRFKFGLDINGMIQATSPDQLLLWLQHQIDSADGSFFRFCWQLYTCLTDAWHHYFSKWLIFCMHSYSYFGICGIPGKKVSDRPGAGRFLR